MQCSIYDREEPAAVIFLYICFVAYMYQAPTVQALLCLAR